MPTDNDYKIVDYYTYCSLCKYADKEEEDWPCRECLEEAVNLYTRRPTRFILAEAE